MERYITGELRGEERARFEEDVLRDEARSEELYQDVNVHAALAGIATGTSTSASPGASDGTAGTDETAASSRARTADRPGLRRKRGWTLGAAVAVAAAVLFSVWTTRPDVGSGPGSSGEVTEDGPRFRSETPLGGFDTFAPRGVLTEAPTEFSWSPEPTAVRYRIRIEKSDGTLLHEEEIAALAAGEGESLETVRYPLVESGIDWTATPAIQWNVTALDESGALIEASPWQPVLVDSP